MSEANASDGANRFGKHTQEATNRPSYVEAAKCFSSPAFEELTEKAWIWL